MFQFSTQDRLNKHGGAPVPHNKNTAEFATQTLPVPKEVVIPLSMHIGAPCAPTCKVGDLVKVGQVIADSQAYVSAPIHASVSGKVTKIGEIIMPNGSLVPAITIASDGLMETDASVQPPQVNSREEFLQAVRASGLVGLGGAGFPTHVKLNPKDLDAVDMLIINAAECEPFITSDYHEMMENSRDVYEGILTVMKYLEMKNCIIAIEDNKPRAVELFTNLCSKNANIQVKSMPARYPQGAEKVLIYNTCQRVVKEGKLPMDAGVIVMNVTSISFLNRYMRTGMPLVSKRITVDGSAVAEPQNVVVPIGTPIRDVMEFCKGYKTQPKKLLMGGPMMGLALSNDGFPVIKNTNAVLALDKEVDETPEIACIRCGRCTRACPFGLMPLFIDKYYHSGNVEELKKYKPNLCMECGCCSFVCPSKRHLTQTIKLAKGLVANKK